MDFDGKQRQKYSNLQRMQSRLDDTAIVATYTLIPLATALVYILLYVAFCSSANCVSNKGNYFIEKSF